MTMYRNQSQQDNYSVGSKPPQVTWTFVKGDTAAFRVYVTDDAQQPLNIADWTIAMKIKRPNEPKQRITIQILQCYTNRPVPSTAKTNC
mgnify:CR=1 FL=1